MLYVFGEWTLDTQRAELSHAGRVSRLRRKAFQVLAYLLAHPDRVVSKQELCEQVWPQQFVSDAALESTIKAVRQALGDSGRGQRLIQTVYGQGYRFLVAVVEAHPEAPAGATGAGHLALLSPPSTLPQAVDDLVPGPSSQETAGTADGGPETDARGEEASLLRGAPASTGEWKLVTVLCCALAESPTGVPLEVEPHYRALRVLYGMAREVVQRYGGTLQPVVGDQLLALFGVPQAQEDHARCAVLAALDLLQRLRPPAPGEGLAVRLGVHSGLGVVGEIGPEAHGPLTAVGAPTQGAMRLQQQAAPGTLLVSAATYDLVREEVQGEPCGSLALDGQQAPLPVYVVQGLLRRQAGVPQRTLRLRSPFVGRQRELALLHDRFEAVRAGEGQVVSLVGPPGMGKSRLLTEFGRRLEPDQVTWVLGQCLAYGQAMPYLPVRDLVQQVCALAAGDPLETRAAAVQRRLAALGGVVEEDVALVLQLLDLPVAPELLARLPPETRQARTFALLGHLLRHAAQHQRLVLAVENVHWIDPTSAAWLGFLIERLAGMAVLLLLTQRPGAQPPWGTHVAVTQLALPPLRAEESQVIVAAVPGTAQLPASRCQQIVAHGAGNPFFVEELAWHAVEHGLSATPVAVPKTVHAVLAARIDRLPAAAKALLQTAAVIGPEVPVPLVQAVTELPEDALQQCLAHLQATELLYETRLFPERAFTFKHALTHEVAYGSLLQERRQVLHARIVEALAALAPDQVAEQVERLAHHALRGEVWDKALAYGRQAGIKAGKRSATREAVMCFEQALGALQHLPESSDIHEQAIDLRFYLVDALFPLGELTQGFEHLCAAQTLAEAMDDQRRLGRVYSIMTLYFWLAGDYARALASGQRALAIAQALDDFPLQVRTHFFLGITYHALGEYCRAIEVLRWNVASLDGELIWRSLGMQGLPAVLSRSWLVWCLAEGGTFAEGIARGAEGYRIAEAADNPFSLVVAYFSVSNLYVCKGEVHQAIPVLERSLEIFRTGDLPVLFPYVASLLEPV